MEQKKRFGVLRNVGMFAAAGIMAFGLAACSDSDGKDDGQEPMAPEKTKEYIEEVGTDFVDALRGASQTELVLLCNHFEQTYGNLEAPEDWFDYDISVPGMMRSLGHALKNKDYSGVTRAFEAQYRFDDYTGVYEPGDWCWKRTGDSKDIVFKFKNAQGGECVLTIHAASGEWSVDANGKTIFIPREVTVTLVDAGTTRLSGRINSNVDFDGHKFLVSKDVDLINLGVSERLSGTDSQIESMVSARANGKEILGARAEVGGHDLCNPEVIRRYIIRDHWPVDLLSNGDVEFNILNRLQVKGQVKNISALINLDTSFSIEYWNKDYTQAQAKEDCEESCRILNNNIHAGIYFNNNKEQAELRFVPNLYEDPYYWEWYVDGDLYFQWDGTSYSVSSYFDSPQFTNVIRQFESLIRSYKNLWK